MEELYGECWACFAPCERDDYCSGCEQFICAECNENDCEGYGRHDPEEHFVEGD